MAASKKCGFKRVLLKLSGEVLKGGMSYGIDLAALQKISDDIRQVYSLGTEIAIVIGGELHHRPRYARYPDFALLLAPGPDCDAEDLAISTALWLRTARNLKFRPILTAVADRPAQELAHALVAAA